MQGLGALHRKATPRGGLSPFGAAIVAGSALALVAAPARASDSLPVTQVAPGFVYVPGESGEVGCLPPKTISTALRTVTTRALDEVGLDPDLAVVLTAGVLTCSSIFYLPLENDVLGIGYGHQHPSELFDETPDHRLQGVAFLNDLPYWQRNPDEFETAFLHEIGHRFLARVHADVDGTEVDLTGRGGDHWSYFSDTGGSPLEGNVWLDGANPAVEPPIADTPEFPLRYSPLDLYLMGAASEDEVGPLRLLLPSEPDAVDCTGRPLGPASPPQTCGPLQVAGSWLPFRVGDIVAREGKRVPAAADAPTRFSVAFLLLDPGGTGFTEAECREVGAWAERLVALFGSATDGRLSMENAAVAERDCADLQLAAEPTRTGGCELTRLPQGAFSSGWSLRLLLVALLGLVTWRHRARPTSARLNQPGGVA